MTINSVASGSSTQVVRPQPPADQTRQAELAKQAEQAKQKEETKAQPVVNTQGQATGSVINTAA
jgi:hypothetical protein